ncbi:unnamed protein product [Mucor fragilis]
MRFSTTNTVSMTHSNSTSTFKKVFSSLVSKLPHQQPSTVAPINKVRVVTSPQSQQQFHIQKRTSAITKQDDIHRNLRDYYTTQNSRKRQYEEPLMAPNAKSSAEREIRHKTVKQYQQTKDKKQQKASYQHWKEYSNTSSNIVNKSAPPKYKTHGYVRDTRSNPNHLRITAISNACLSSTIISKEKPCLPKRRDEFQWGSKSKLSNAL